MSDFKSKPKTTLTDLKIDEVSLVDKSAIEEEFTIIKSADEEIDKVCGSSKDKKIKKEESEDDTVEKKVTQKNGKWYVMDHTGTKELGGPYDTEDEAKNRLRQIEYFKHVKKDEQQLEICNKIKDLSDEDFTGIMSEMMSRYNIINKSIEKGGVPKMEEKDVKLLVDGIMESVNKNFVEINKKIDEIQKGAKTDEEIDPSKDLESVKKAVTDLGTAVKDLVSTVEKIATSVETIDALKESVKKIEDLKVSESIESITKKIEDIEKQDGNSNSLETDESVSKGDKAPFWKSFLGGE